MAAGIITRIGSTLAGAGPMVTRPGDNPSDPFHAGFMTHRAASWINSGGRAVNHVGPAKGRERFMTQLTRCHRREVIRRKDHDAASP